MSQGFYIILTKGKIMGIIITDNKLTLYDLCRLIRHRNHAGAMKMVSKLVDDGNALFSSLSVSNHKAVNGKNIKTYRLNCHQAIAITSKINDKFLMKIIRQYQESDRQRQFSYFSRSSERRGIVKSEAIKKLQSKAMLQGSKNTGMFFVSYARMQNNIMFTSELDKKPKNWRDEMSAEQINIMEVSDCVVARGIQNGLDQDLPYKEIFQVVKKRMIMFRSLVGGFTLTDEKNRQMEMPFL